MSQGRPTRLISTPKRKKEKSDRTKKKKKKKLKGRITRHRECVNGIEKQSRITSSNGYCRSPGRKGKGRYAAARRTQTPNTKIGMASKLYLMIVEG